MVVFDSLLPIANNHAQLVDAVSLLLTAGALPATQATRIVTTLASLPTGTPVLEKVRMATYLVLTSPTGAIQK